MTYFACGSVTGVFAAPFANWKWDWLDVPALIDGGGPAWEYPMCDRDPLLRWPKHRLLRAARIR